MVMREAEVTTLYRGKNPEKWKKRINS